MSDEKTSLTAALRHLAEQERRTPSEHATPGELTAYHEGTLPPAIEARVREHLGHCKLCSDLLLDLAGFADLAPPPGVPELTDAQVAEDWQALRARIGAEKEEAAATVVPFRREPTAEPQRSRRSPPWFAIAASLLALVGFSLAAYQNQEVARLREPRWAQGQNVSAEGDARRGPQEEMVKISSKAGDTLFLQPDSDDLHSAYEAEIFLGDQEIIKLPAQAVDSVAITIPPGGLEPGEYRILLYGIEQGQRKPVGEFLFRVDDP